MGHKLKIPAELRAHVTETLGPRGKEWLDDLPRLVELLGSAWHIEVAEPFGAGEFNFVAPAMRDGTEDVVIKIAPPFETGEFLSEAAYLRHQAGGACVRLLAEDRDLGALMMERAMPGLTLSEEFAGRESEVVAAAIAVIRDLKTDLPLRLDESIKLDDWFGNLERARGTDFPRAYAIRALEFYRELSCSSPRQYLHGDFHPGNIVTATRRPYLAIDPKGIIGALGYDIAVFLNELHCWNIEKPHLSELLDVAVTQFSTAFKIPEIDLRRWAFAVQVLGSWWTFDEMPALYSGGVVKADIWDV